MEKQDKPAANTESLASTESSQNEVAKNSSQTAGATSYKTRVAEHVVERAIYRVPGTTDVDGGLLSRNYPRFDVRLDQEAQKASVDVVIAVVWPSPAVRVAAEVRKAVAEALDVYMGYEATRVNVTIGEAVPSKQRISRADVQARSSFTPRQISVGEIEVSQPQVEAKTEILREIEVAKSAPLRDVSVADEVPLREITTNPRISELTEVKSRNLAVQRPVEAPWPKPLSVISVAERSDPVSVEVPAAKPLREITINELPLSRKVKAPKPMRPFSPNVPSQRKLKKVDVPKQQPLREVRVVEPVALREVSIGDLPEVPVEAPQQQPLRDVVVPEPQELVDVNTRSFASRPVELPPERKLRKVRATKPRVHPAQAPKPRKLREVDVRRKKLRKVQAPKPLSLRDIEVANAGRPSSPVEPKQRKLRKVRTPMKQQLRKPYAPMDHPFRKVTVPRPQPLREIYRKDTRQVIQEMRGGSRG